MKAENRHRILQVVLTLLTLLLIGWIFSNSLKTASESSSQSSKVRVWIQTFFDALFPGVSVGFRPCAATKRFTCEGSLCAGLRFL